MWAGNYNVYYLADGGKNPLGEKTSNQILKIVISWIENFQRKDKNLIVIVIACNTASIVIQKKIPYLEKKFGIKIITMIDCVEAIINKNKSKIKNKNNLIIGTKITIKSKLFDKLFGKIPSKKIISLIGTKTERFVARGLEKNKKAKKEMENELNKYSKEKVDNILLGCTCYKFIKKDLKNIYGEKISFLNPSKKVSEKTKKILKPRVKKLNLSKMKVYSTGNLKNWTKNFNIISKKIFNRKLYVKRLN